MKNKISTNDIENDTILTGFIDIINKQFQF